MVAKLGLDTSEYDKGLNDAGKNGKSFGQKVGGVLKTGAKVAGAGLAAAATAAVAFSKASVDAGMKFDASMSQVAAISGATGQDLVDLREKAQEMGSKTKFSASEAADAFTYMAMAGWKSGDMLDGIEGLMNLAAASGEDLATTSDIVTDALTAFGLKAQDSGHFADILAAASSNANTNVGMMGETFKYAAPIAGALGYSAEDTAIAIGLMANAGIKSSQAGTSLRTIMTSLTGEVKLTGKAFGEAVIQTTNADGSMREFSSIIENLRYYWRDLTEAEKANTAEALVGKNAMSGFLAIMNAGEEDINKLTDAVWECDDAALNMATTMQDNLAGDITIFKSALEGAQIALSDVLTPALRDFVQWGTDAVSRLTLAFKEDGLSGAISEASEIMGETLATLKYKFEEAFNNAITAISEINWSEVGQNILDWIVGGLQGMSNTFWSLFDKAKAFVKTVNWVEVGLAIVDFVLNGLDALGALMWSNFIKAKEAIKEINWGDVGKAILAFISLAWLKIKSWAKEKWDKAKAGIQDVNWAEVGEKVKTAVGTAWSQLKTWATGLWDKARAGIEDVKWEALGRSIWNTIKTGLGSIAEKMKGFFDDAKTKIEGIDWAQLGTNLWDWISTPLKSIAGGIKGFFDDGKSEVEGIDWSGLGTSILEFILKAFTSLSTLLYNFFSAAWKDIKAIDWDGLGEAIRDFILDGLEELGNKMRGLGQDGYDGIAAIDWLKLGADILAHILYGLVMLPVSMVELARDGFAAIMGQRELAEDAGYQMRSAFMSNPAFGSLPENVKQAALSSIDNVAAQDWSGTGKKAESQVVEGMSGLPGDVKDLGDRAAKGFSEGSGQRNVWSRVADIAAEKLTHGIAVVEKNITGVADSSARGFEAARWASHGSEAGLKVANAFKSSAEKALDSIKTLQDAINNIKGKTVSINIQQKVTTTNAGAANTKDRNGKISPNARAMDTGYIFRHPTVFAYADNAFQVAGDVGAEAVVGVYSLDKMIQNSVNAAVGRTQAAMVGVLSEILDKMPKGQLVLDTGALVGGIAPEMNNELERITAWSGGGRA